MRPIAKMRTTWQTTQCSTLTRGPVLRSLAVVLLALSLAYLLFPPIFAILAGIGRVFPSRLTIAIPEPEEDTFKHFAGRECGITRSSIYHVPLSTTPNVSPFCKNRVTLLTAMSGGSRHGFGEPYVGKGCTYRWFSTPEICMILERHSSVVFVGDKTAQAIYTALNILLSEDLALGGLQSWNLGRKERVDCKCDGQFTNEDCLKYTIRSVGEARLNSAGRDKASTQFCRRVSHVYIPANTTPAEPSSVLLFKDLTYNKPHPWQPSPLIYSSFTDDTMTATQTLDEWSSLAAGAGRNIPMLYLGAHAVIVRRDGDAAVLKANEDMAAIATEKHFEFLGLWNLTSQVGKADDERFGSNVALVEAMIIINWLSKIASS